MPEAAIRGYAKLQDTRVYYEIYGAGEPVLLLHGNGETLHIFDKMIARLMKGYRVIALDTRGHGRSGRGTKPFDFHTFSQDVYEVLGLLNQDCVRVVGYSDGASTAMHLALAYPDKVKGLALLGANLDAKGVHARFQIPITCGYLLCKAIARVDKGAVHKRDLLGLMVNHPNLAPEQLHAIACPALVIAGQADMIKREHTACIAASIPAAEMEIIAGEDHFTLPRSAVVTKRIRAFFAGG